jgi:dihydrofolate synthase/folylpolyglutamate synthase
MTYESALAYLAGLNESRIRPGLGKISRALISLGSPQFKYYHVVVGGTNGKGSVVTLMASILESAGYHVGRYTSPHLHRFEERIAVDGDSLDPVELEDLVLTIKALGIDLSYFEFATAMALVHFARRPVDIALLEVGIGGRWDATNVTDPILSVITSIAVDHREWLGDSLEEIAAEKAMIMRRARPIIVGGAGSEALGVILKEADRVGSRVILSGRDFSARWEGTGSTLHFEGRKWGIPGLKLGLAGGFQLENAAISLAALECLADEGFIIPRTAVFEGLATASWPGRYQDLGGQPNILVDSAHNRAAVKALVQSLGVEQNIVWLFSALRNKDLEGMAGEMLCAGNRFVLVPLDHPRAYKLDDMKNRMPVGSIWTTAVSTGEGLREAVRQAGAGGRVVAAGSVFLAAAVLETIRGKE